MKKMLTAVTIVVLVLSGGVAMARNGDTCVVDAQCLPGYCAKSSYGSLGVCVGSPNVFEWPDTESQLDNTDELKN